MIWINAPLLAVKLYGWHQKIKMKIKLLFSLLAIAIFHPNCTILRQTKNKSTINLIRKNTAFIKECAALSIYMTLDKEKKSFSVKDIEDKKIRNKIASLCQDVFVIYNDSSYEEIPDSVVTFSSFSLAAGITEIVYDFAFNPRTFSNTGTRKSEYYFVKVADRIYYRKKPIPMM